ncbi:M48 family metallopeptidase [Novosphingobium sp.]|uniref:M48 family metallopeptidase n=1 Tax=Novosphingobium sp. TaxID=1874826 RepID=UPI00286C0D6D|nr:M48 family metallopeptidase [Novosphingobium sp.]
MRLKLLAVAVLMLALLPGTAHAAPFDVETATRAYLDTLQGAARAKSNAYFEGGYWLVLWGTLVSVLADGLLLRFGLSVRFRALGERLFKRLAGVTWITALCYTVAGTILTLPWSIYTGFVREKQYDLMNQSLSDWLIDQGKDVGINLLIVPLIVMAVYAVIRRFPKNWWVMAAGVITGFLAFGMLIGPVFISPLFNTYTELPGGPIRDRIVAMAKAKNIPSEHIYLFDASKQSKRISANVSGIGPTIRISLNDNLLNRSTPQEIAGVMGHEMGHYVLNHVWWSLAFLSALAALAMFLVSRIGPALIARYGARWGGIRDLGDPASMPVLGILLAVFGLLATPLTNTLVRVDESQADAFGLDVAQEPDGFASVAMKLSEYRKIEPSALEEMLFFDHPSGATRVRMSMQWKKDHVPNAQMVVPPPMPQAELTPQ